MCVDVCGCMSECTCMSAYVCGCEICIVLIGGYCCDERVNENLVPLCPL